MGVKIWGDWEWGYSGEEVNDKNFCYKAPPHNKK